MAPTASLRKAIISAAAVLALGLPATAHAASLDAVTLYSDPGAFIGQGRSHLFTAPTNDIRITPSESGVFVGVYGPNYDEWGLSFYAPLGQPLTPGVYDNAGSGSSHSSQEPTIGVSGQSRGCDGATGWFEVKDIATRPDGTVERLWIVFEHRCGVNPYADFGEVRIGEAGQSGVAALAPSVIRWPSADFGRLGTVVPETVVASSSMRIDDISIDGENAADFYVREDECRGRVLAAGESCRVWMRYDPAAPGDHSATLRLRGSDGTDYSVPLRAFSNGGRTRLAMNSDPGDYVGAGRSWFYTPADASFRVSGSRRLINFSIEGADGAWWFGTFAPGDGDIVTPGGTYSGTRYPFNGPGSGMDVSGNGRGCNHLTGTFAVNEATFKDDGSLSTISLDFEQHCENALPALHGTFEYRAGDLTQAAPWFSEPPAAEPQAAGSEAPTGQSDVQAEPQTSDNPALTPGPAPPSATSGSADRGIAVPNAPSEPRSPCAAGARATRRVVRNGTTRKDTVRGTRRPDILMGFAGNDLLLGRAGADCLDGGSGNDHLVGGPGNDTLIGGPGRDVLDCGPGTNDVAYASRGDVIRGCERRLK